MPRNLTSVLIVHFFGSISQQGSSVINNVLRDPKLCKLYTIIRDAASGKAKQLQERVEVVEGDISDREAMRTSSTGPEAVEIRLNVAKNIVDVVVLNGVKYLPYLVYIASCFGGEVLEGFRF
ncbi:hypothetical protein AC578_1055 [Pseudocercospora eumusae]|uniref:Uncharacterized protein n=1 Tax=Pseudocercospora eumusae TaxID=321146 RepID=A0A139HTL6_9PEZI|nr:hypothetical protein AC578_1055 [Pseudocercospora eumusae]